MTLLLEVYLFNTIIETIKYVSMFWNCHLC